ncbi:MAG: sulfatase-like hydrolase/transferase [Chitinophagales bacterium]
MKLVFPLLVVFFVLNSYSDYAQTSRPNIIMIIADDLRYDAFSMTGGPSFLQTPSIDKIANEGARFDNFFCVYPLCIPSRATLLTGLYPHSHGATDNCTFIKPSIKTVPEILDGKGYHTGMIGKYHIETKKQDGWDYWFVTSRKIEYEDPTFYFNSTEQAMTGHVENIINDTVHRYLSEVDTPFFVTIGHPSPHRPVTPLPQYDGIYDDETMPIPDNFYQFSAWYPSFLYQDTDKLYTEEKDIKKDFKNYYAGILAVEDNVTDIFSILESRNLLDNTMIIFLSDNGANYGEHELKGKGKVYDPSIHLPLFIRYPAWYPANTVVDGNFFCLNIDIMPTILDAAKINYSAYHPQGTSVQKLISGAVQRDAFLFENIKLGNSTCDVVEDSDNPSMRGIVTKDYKYVKSQCDHFTEELYDLNADPLETTNLIYKPDYQNVLNDLRDQLAALKIQYFDTLKKDKKIRECWLIKCNPESIHAVIIGDTLPFKMSPNPATETVNFYGEFDAPTTITISNLMGQVMYNASLVPGEDDQSYNVDVTGFSPGVYFVAIRQGKNLEVKTLLKN